MTDGEWEHCANMVIFAHVRIAIIRVCCSRINGKMPCRSTNTVGAIGPMPGLTIFTHQKTSSKVNYISVSYWVLPNELHFDIKNQSS